MGINALDDARYNEAADHFTAAIDNGILPNEQVIHSKYEIFIIVRSYDSTGNDFHVQACAL